MSHDIKAILTNRVTRSTVLLDIAAGHLANILHLEWVTEEDGSADLALLKAVGGVVHDHGALRVTANNDLGLGALAESLLNQLGHDGATVCAHLGVALVTS